MQDGLSLQSPPTLSKFVANIIDLPRSHRAATMWRRGCDPTLARKNASRANLNNRNENVGLT